MFQYPGETGVRSGEPTGICGLYLHASPYIIVFNKPHLDLLQMKTEDATVGAGESSKGTASVGDSFKDGLSISVSWNSPQNTGGDAAPVQ